MSLISKEHLSLTLQTIKTLLSRKADKSELQEEISKVSSNIANSDWNQNDERAPDYVKNRPFYDGIEDVLVSEVEVTEVLTENFALSNPDENGKRKEFYRTANNIKLSSAKYICGKEYIIDINGEQYVSRFSCISDGEYPGVYAVGFNIDSLYMSSVHPIIDSEFCLVGSHYISELLLDGEECDTELSCYLSSDIALPATIKIKHREKVLKQLDHKYIKDMYYTETVQKSETREFERSLVDPEFVRLLIDNRKTAQYTINTDTFVFYEDVGNVGYDVPSMWGITNSDGTTIPITTFQSTPESSFDGVGVRAPIISITVNYEVEEVHKIGEKYLPDSALARSDWNQNDENDAGYIKNRTHWEEENILDITGLEYIVADSMMTTVGVYEHTPVPFEIGQKWGLYYNPSNDQWVEMTTYETCILEDGSIGIGSTGMFVTKDSMTIPTSFISQIKPLRMKIVGVSGTYTGEPIIHQLDPKYIKDMYHETSIEEVVIEEDVEMTAGMNSCEGSFSVNINVVPNDTYTLYVNGTLYGTATASSHLLFGSGYNLWQINNGGGVYTFYDSGVYTLKLVHNASELKQLDEKYIPDSIARVEDVEAVSTLVGDTSVSEQINTALSSSAVPVPTTAQVGQLLSVKAVDENGKPTEWEAVDPFVLTDESTGTKYKLSVSDGKLVMNEVASG